MCNGLFCKFGRKQITFSIIHWSWCFWLRIDKPCGNHSRSVRHNKIQQWNPFNSAVLLDANDCLNGFLIWQNISQALVVEVQPQEAVWKPETGKKTEKLHPALGDQNLPVLLATFRMDSIVHPCFADCSRTQQRPLMNQNESSLLYCMPYQRVFSTVVFVSTQHHLTLSFLHQYLKGHPYLLEHCPSNHKPIYPPLIATEHLLSSADLDELPWRNQQRPRYASTYTGPIGTDGNFVRSQAFLGRLRVHARIWEVMLWILTTLTDCHCS